VTNHVEKLSGRLFRVGAVVLFVRLIVMCICDKAWIQRAGLLFRAGATCLSSVLVLRAKFSFWKESGICPVAKMEALENLEQACAPYSCLQSVGNG